MLCLLCRWDIFPGITPSEVPAGSKSENETAESDQISDLPVLHQNADSAKQKVSKKKINDLLARTFDVQDMDASE